MLGELLGKKQEVKHVPQFLQNFSETQQRLFDEFSWLMYEKDFAVGKDIFDDDRISLSISTYDQESFHLGKIIEPGNVQLIYPKPNSIDDTGFKYMLDDLFRLKSVLSERYIEFTEGINKKHYIEKVRLLTEKKVEDIVQKINE